MTLAPEAQSVPSFEVPDVSATAIVTVGFAVTVAVTAVREDETQPVVVFLASA